MKIKILNNATEEEVSIITTTLIALSSNRTNHKEEKRKIEYWKRSFQEQKYNKDIWNKNTSWKTIGMSY